MCPYARFQSAMFDKDTLIISYDEKRGEPRSHHKAGTSWEGHGHCIDCNSCVAVCPMGIDIREGLQMECIACGLCVDACNDVMDKVGLPQGLIRYNTQSAKEKGIAAKLQLLRPRTIWYSTILSIVSCMILYGLITRSPLELTVIHDRNPLFVQLSDGSIRNGYNISIANKTHRDQTYTIDIEDLDNFSLHVQGNSEIKTDDLKVFADSVGHFRIFLSAQKQGEPRRKITFKITENTTNLVNRKNTIFISKK
jgi:cytochrome c oxidase accessory protein FixG